MGAVLLAPAIVQLAHTHETSVLWWVLLLNNSRSTPIVVVRGFSALFKVHLLVLLVRGNWSLRFIVKAYASTRFLNQTLTDCISQFLKNWRRHPSFKILLILNWDETFITKARLGPNTWALLRVVLWRVTPLHLHESCQIWHVSIVVIRWFHGLFRNFWLFTDGSCRVGRLMPWWSITDQADFLDSLARGRRHYWW